MQSFDTQEEQEEHETELYRQEKAGEVILAEHEGRVYVVARWLAEVGTSWDVPRFELDHEHDDYMMAALAQWETDGAGGAING